MDSVKTTLPSSPIKYIPIAEFCLVSNSEITCLHPPQGAIGVLLILEFEPATIAKQIIVALGYLEFA